MSNLLRRAIIGGAGAGGAPVSPADVFSTDLWIGNGTGQNILNGNDYIDGDWAVWTKCRDLAVNHSLVDSIRGATNNLTPNETFAQGSAQTVTAFNADGYTVGSSASTNEAGYSFVGWSFRKSPRFFDVITYTGDGVAGREIPHNLGVQAGLVMVKKLNTSGDWTIQHVSRGGTKYLTLNSNVAEGAVTGKWNDINADDTKVTLGNNTTTNFNGSTYVMYVFAHDDSASSVIKCGQHNGTGVLGAQVELGWQPQFVLYKAATDAQDWLIYDTARATNRLLRANTSQVEVNSSILTINATGFTLDNTGDIVNGAGQEYIYMAIKAE